MTYFTSGYLDALIVCVFNPIIETSLIGQSSVFLYSSTQKCYKCYYPKTKRLIVSRDVRFDESNSFFQASDNEFRGRISMSCFPLLFLLKLQKTHLAHPSHFHLIWINKHPRSGKSSTWGGTTTSITSKKPIKSEKTTTKASRVCKLHFTLSHWVRVSWYSPPFFTVPFSAKFRMRLNQELLLKQINYQYGEELCMRNPEPLMITKLGALFHFQRDKNWLE